MNSFMSSVSIHFPSSRGSCTTTRANSSQARVSAARKTPAGEDSFWRQLRVNDQPSNAVYSMFVFAEDPPTVVSCASFTQLGPSSYEMDANHGSWPADGFCRVIRMDEINAGDPYTINVDLYNVIAWGGADSGHLGVMYNAVDENNFDVFYFRLVTCEKISFPIIVIFIWRPVVLQRVGQTAFSPFNKDILGPCRRIHFQLI